VGVSWPKFVLKCKSRFSAIARSCFLGRASWRRKFQKLKEEFEKLTKEHEESESLREELEQENARLRERTLELERELASPSPIQLPLGDKPPEQQFGAGLIALSVNLSREVGLRPTERVLKIFFEWLEVQQRIPTHTAIRLWTQRIGLYRMQSAEKAKGGAWIVDHTNQISKTKVLALVRVRNRRLRRRAKALSQEDIEILLLKPGEEWKREDVKKVYDEMVKRYGLPRAIETDGAVELREPAENLGKPGEKPLVIRDPKHFLANRLEALLKQDSQYAAFAEKFGGTRSALQQTELAQFLPPAFKTKARFMNLAPILKWASVILWHLKHPESQSRKTVSQKRLLEKLGWVHDFAPNIRQWQMCQDVISTALTFLNQNGVFKGAAEQLKKRFRKLDHCGMSQQLVDATLEFVRQYEGELRDGEYLPMSTEILESVFARYKHFEKQHSKSGFTSLLLALPTLLKKTTAEEVTEAFACVKVADVKKWSDENLPNTLASKRQLVYREARNGMKKNQPRATDKPIAA
jgi:hypothetical protein